MKTWNRYAREYSPPTLIVPAQTNQYAGLWDNVLKSWKQWILLLVFCPPTTIMSILCGRGDERWFLVDSACRVWSCVVGRIYVGTRNRTQRASFPPFQASQSLLGIRVEMVQRLLYLAGTLSIIIISTYAIFSEETANSISSRMLRGMEDWVAYSRLPNWQKQKVTESNVRAEPSFAYHARNPRKYDW